ncbi:diacylglycerol kinase [Acinetobacter gandensis]|uniref:Diacylglycerol kinase n=1 Tax=Acinetobacter gandensis TaxID=1443941 RepID=A0A1A7RDV4_9GAMM|nr:diacylglycerol kinase family protein [Acinetobacter gandensis]KAB0626151.1 diacylglycerol kinase [Acinetobacter gandensis]OBX29704.1 diacylglycerol kinase [Acinetobacter gandensis]
MSLQTKPLSIIYNKNSGFHAANKEAVYEELVQVLSSHGYEIQSFELGQDVSFDALMDKVLARHQQQQEVGVVVAAGGDGTLNAVAQRLMHTNIPMGILPLGTFNYVARVLNIPLDLIQAANVIATGQNREVHVAQLNDHIYLNNASLGLYPLFIQKREFYNQKFGRFPLHAYTSGLDVLIRDRKELKLEIEVDHHIYPVKTPLIFFGNNQLQLADLNLKIAKDAAQGKVAGVVVAKSDKRTLFKLLWQLMRGNIEKAPDVYSFAAEQVTIHTKRNKITVAIDGEIVEMKPPLQISVKKNALKIRVPHDPASV